MGIILDSGLTFEYHINHLFCSLNFTLKRLYCLNINLPLQVRRNVAHALMSKLLYGLEVYSATSITLTNRIKVLFNSVARYVFNVPLSYHISDYTKQLLSLDVENYILFRLLFFFYKIITTQAPQYLTNQFAFSRSMRSQQILIPRIFNTLYERSLLVRVARCWNRFPSDLKLFNLSPSVFKDKLLLYAANNRLLWVFSL